MRSSACVLKTSRAAVGSDGPMEVNTSLPQNVHALGVNIVWLADGLKTIKKVVSQAREGSYQPYEVHIRVFSTDSHSQRGQSRQRGLWCSGLGLLSALSIKYSRCCAQPSGLGVDSHEASWLVN